MHARSPHDRVTEMLVLDAQSGDEQAFAKLYHLWSPRLARHVGRLVNDADATRDVSQETWLAIARSLRSVGDPAAFGAWAYRIATRRAADWVRDRQRRRRLDREHPSENGTPDAPDLDPVRAAIRSLAPEQRAILSMHHADAMSLAHIAEALQIPVGTVKSRLFAARNELRRALEHHQEQAS